MAVIWVRLMTLVVNGAPAQRTSEPGGKIPPETISVKDGPPAKAPAGVKEALIGDVQVPVWIEKV